jgi:hypothetical protein
MNRLPVSDRTTCRSELAVFASLGFAGVLMVALATSQATRLTGGGDHIATGLEAASLAESNRAVANKVTGPADPRSGHRLSLPTKCTLPSTPG